MHWLQRVIADERKTFMCSQFIALNLYAKLFLQFTTNKKTFPVPLIDFLVNLLHLQSEFNAFVYRRCEVDAEMTRKPCP